ncbi:TerD family protein [Streptomyces sp. NPDC004111]|uniref:TerD family protein n=1 Tax=Streptomyces sp. NPDC004111 TaxID=3364690 RepID=UPI00368DB123
MHDITKGANVPLSALTEDHESIAVSLRWNSSSGEGDADVSVLLLGEDGKVRSNDDFYFYNNPAAADGSVQLLGLTPTDDGTEDRIQLSLSAIPADVARLVVAASRHQRAEFGEFESLGLELADGAGEKILRFAITDATTESAFVFGEVYRRGEEWKFRAVGQGYDTGLAGLATDYGIDIEEDDDQGEGPDDEGTRAEADQAAAPGSPEAASVPRPAVLPESPLPAVPAQAAAPEPPRGAHGTAPSETASAEAVAPDTAATAAAPGAAAAPPRRLRTAKKKVTLPKVAKPSLAENDAWRPSRLFPASTLKSDREREMRATSVLLSVMAQVPELGRRLTAGFGAPAGRMETFTEVSLPHGDSPKRPDGVIRVERAGKLWTALVETKTNGNPLKSEQIQAYADIAARRGYEAVITLSNDVALEGSPLVDVKIDGRRKNKVALWHLSWAEVAHQAQMLIRHEGVRHEAHAWLLQELLHYLQHENSGCHGFQNMGSSWVPVRKGIDEETLCPGDARTVHVVESWERLVRQVCLRLGGELGVKVIPVQRAKRGADPQARRVELADRFCEDGRLQAEIRVEGAVGILSLTADLRLGRLRTSVDVPAPEQGYPLSWAKRLVKQLEDAPADLHVQTLVDGEGTGPRGTMEKLRREPGDLLPKDAASIVGFRLSLSKGVGSTRGNAETGFIRSVDAAVAHFYVSVVDKVTRSAGGRAKAAPAAGRVPA